MMIHRKRAPRHPRERRIWRKDRTVVALTLLLAVIAGMLMTIVHLCSSPTPETYGVGKTREPMADAIEQGRADAAKVLEYAPETMERQNALLFIKSRESALRLNGYINAADDYVKAANDYLNTHTNH